MQNIATIHETAPAGQVTGIIHISDLHISERSADRFRDVSGLFFEDLKTRNLDPGSNIMAILGDVFDRKTTLSAMDIALFNEFIERAGAVMPVIIIAGNHDTSLSAYRAPEMVYGEPHNLISPLLVARKTKYPVLFYPRTGVYAYRNLQLAVLSVLEHHPGALDAKVHGVNLLTLGQTAPFQPWQPQHHRRIGMFHEQVEGAQFEGTRFERCLPLASLCLFNATLLGDQHEHEMFHPNVGYSGAFMQQKANETLNKGYLIWNIATTNASAVFVPLRGRYGSVRIKVKKGQAPMVDKPEIITGAKIEFEGFTPAEIAEEHRRICALHGLPSGTGYINMSPPAALGISGGSSLDIFDVDKFAAKLRVLLHGEQAQLQDATIALHRETLAKYPSIGPKATNRRRYSIDKMYWSNYICYGQGNAIDFTRCNGKIAGVVAANGTGKSSILRLIMLALFNYPARDRKDMIRDPRCSASVQMMTSHGEIHRDHQPGAAASVDSIHLDGQQMVNWAGSAVHLGDLEAALRICIKTQDADYDFITGTSNQDRKAFLYRLFDLDAFDQMLVATKDEHKSLAAIIAVKTGELTALMQGNSIPLAVQLADAETALEVLNKALAESTDRLRMFEEKRRSLDATRTHHRYDSNKHQADAFELKKIVDRLGGVPKHDAAYVRARIEEMSARLVPDISLAQMPASAVTQANASILKAELAKLTAVIESQPPAVSGPTPQDIYNETMGLKTTIAGLRKQLASVPDSDIALAEQELRIIEAGVRDSASDYNPACDVCTRRRDRNDASSAGHVRRADELRARIIGLRTEAARAESANEDINARIQEISDLLASTEDRHRSAVRLLEKRMGYLTASMKHKEITALLKSIEASDYNKGIREKINCYRQVLDAMDRHREYTDLVDAHEVAKTHADADTGIMKMIDSAGQGITLYNQKICDYNRHIGAATADVEDLRRRIASYTSITVEVNTMSARLSVVSAYERCLDRQKGVPFMFLAEILSSINDMVNPLLLRLASFSVEIQIPDSSKNAIDISIVHPHSPKHIDILEASGYQKFVISLVFRIALFNLYTGPLPDSLIIDEGFGCLDAGNLSRVKDFLLEIKTYFRNIFIISHLPEMQNAIEMPLVIESVNGISHIANTTEIAPDLPRNLHRMTGRSTAKIVVEEATTAPPIINNTYIHYDESLKKHYCTLCTPQNRRYFVMTKGHMATAGHIRRLAGTTTTTDQE